MNTYKDVANEYLLSSAFQGLKQTAFFNLLNVFDTIQTKWNIFCREETYDLFKR